MCDRNSFSTPIFWKSFLTDIEKVLLIIYTCGHPVLILSIFTIRFGPHCVIMFRLVSIITLDQYIVTSTKYK